MYDNYYKSKYLLSPIQHKILLYLLLLSRNSRALTNNLKICLLVSQNSLFNVVHSILFI